ncbi:MAG: hypothetical protein Q8O82_18815 [Pseudorhodobacter sp.]|nr:hypothetical protein [Pseudorhodobacter sp.]
MTWQEIQETVRRVLTLQRPYCHENRNDRHLTGLAPKSLGQNFARTITVLGQKYFSANLLKSGSAGAPGPKPPFLAEGLWQEVLSKSGSLIAAVSSGIAICPFGIMVLSEVARCAS